MEEKNTAEFQKRKIYKFGAVFTGSFLGGPLTAIYFIAENYKALSQPEKARKTWVYGISATILIAAAIIIIYKSIIYLIPGNPDVPDYIFPVICSLIACSVVMLQKNEITKHIDSGGGYFPWHRTASVTAIGIAATLLLYFGLGQIPRYSGDNNLSRKVYGLMRHEIFYQKDNISRDEVEKIAEGLHKNGLFGDNTEGSICMYADKAGGNIEVIFPIEKTAVKVIESPDAIKKFEKIKADVQELFPENKVILKVTSASPDNVVRVFE